MSDLLDRIIDSFPANNDVGVPLKSDITITLSGLDYDEDSLFEGLFLEGPDTDQFVGPGLQFQTYPANVSQNDTTNLNVDDFLQSPGYKGLVVGDYQISRNINTVITFTPHNPLAALTEYTVYLHSVTTSSLADIDGFVSFSFETGSGSIEEVSSTISTSILNVTRSISVLDTTGTPLQVVKMTPSDRSVQNSTDLRQIIIEFNKAIDPTSVTNDTVNIIASAITDHPALSIQAQGELVKSVEVNGALLIINI